jgi:WG containing repeat
MQNKGGQVTQAEADETTKGAAMDVLRGVPPRTRRLMAIAVAISIPIALALATWLVVHVVDVARSRPWSVAAEWPNSREEAPPLFPVRQDGKWGYIDKAGQLVIGFQYDDAAGFSDGLAAVMVDGRWGYVDESGSMVIAPQFDAAGSFFDGLAAVGGVGMFDGFDGFIDNTGRLVIPPNPELKYSRDFSEGLAGVVLRDGNWGFMDRTGKVVIRLHGVESCYWFQEGLCRVVAIDGRTGYINRSGDFMIKPQFTGASDFSNGFAIAQYEGRRHLIIDTAGRVVREIGFDQAYGFSEGRAPVTQGGVWAAMDAGLDTSNPGENWEFIDESGALVIATQFASVYGFRGGLAYVEGQDGKMAYIDLDGHYVWQEK